MALCIKCQDLAIHDAIHRTLAGEAETTYYGSCISVEDWHDSLGTIHESSGTCSLCALVIKAWRLERPIAVEDKLRSGDVPPSMIPKDLDYDVVDVEPYQNGRASVSLQKRTDRADDGRHSVEFFLNITIQVTGSRGSWDTYEALPASFRISNGDGAPSASVQDILVNPDPLSQSAVQVARAWVENCINKHKSCVANSARLPTRLLDISETASTGKVILREMGGSTRDSDNHYVALSHCWGGGDTIRTTRATLENHRGGISMSHLPQSFRDGVEVAQKLGMRYLWIDSLCIIQDDVDDWQKEAADMAMVYREAYLVLAASRGSSDSEGFLGIRDRLDVVTLPSRSPQTQMDLVVQLQPPQRTDRTGWATIDLLAQEPLSMRAWCLQEKYLARRVLFYGSRQMVWECQEVGAAEDGKAYVIDGGPLVQIQQTANVVASLIHRVSRERFDGNQGVNCVDWYKMVTDYTGRAITKSSDRLPALSGLANATAQVSKDVYFAGLWKSSLIEGLAWCGGQGSQSLEKPDEYVAPSWSWASVVGSVQFPLYEWYDRARWIANMADFEPLANYAGHEFQLQDQDPSGRLKGGWLRMSAALWSITATEPRQTEEPDIIPSMYFGQAPRRSLLTDKTFCARHTRRNRKTTQIWLEGGYDVALQESGEASDRQHFIMFLARLPFVIENGFLEYRFGVILEKVGEGATYRRIGFVDGFILSKAHSSAMRMIMKFAESNGAEAFGIQGFQRPLKDGDLHNTERLNDLARDPFSKVDVTEIKIV